MCISAICKRNEGAGFKLSFYSKFRKKFKKNNHQIQDHWLSQKNKQFPFLSVRVVNLTLCIDLCCGKLIAPVNLWFASMTTLKERNPLMRIRSIDLRKKKITLHWNLAHAHGAVQKSLIARKPSPLGCDCADEGFIGGRYSH